MTVKEQKKLIRRECELMPDDRLIRLTLDGEPVAYDVLVERYRPRVNAVAFQYLNPSDREDCVQETFLKALASLGSLRDADKFCSWLGVIARNICLDLIKKSSQISSIDDDSPWDFAHGTQISSPRPSPLAEVLREDEHARLRESIALLGEKYRRAISMRYFEDCDYSTIAETLHKPLGTVKSLIHRGHDKLRDLLAEGAIQSKGAVVN